LTMARMLATFASLAWIALGTGALAQEAELRAGKAAFGPVQSECAGAALLDNLAKLCNLIPGAFCPTAKSSCQSTARQIFMGTALGKLVPQGGPWNGMGGSGELMADTLICNIRELSPQLRGPIQSKASINLGIGTLTATQEIGFLDFQRINPVVRGYRRITFDMPVVGRSEAITQDFTLTKRTYAEMGAKPVAGNREIDRAFAINLTAEAKTRDLGIQTLGFPVTTPIGVFTVTPKFEYHTRTSVIASPFAAAHTDIPNFLGAPNTVRFSDIYGLDQGMQQSAKLVNYPNMASMRTGWLSQIGLGTRGNIANTGVWTGPGTGLILRPELDPSIARSAAEAEPSINVSATAQVKYPENPKDLLPSWVFGIPYLALPEAYVTIAPTVEAGAGGQFDLGAGEGSNHIENQEFRFISTRFSAATMVAGLNIAASFNVKVGFRLLVKANFPWPVNEITFVDIDTTIPVPLYGDKVTGATYIAGSWSTGEDRPETLDYLKTLQGVEFKGPAATAGFIQQCYAPGAQPAASTPAPTPPAPGKPEDLFDKDKLLWPCNICLNTRGVDYDGKQNASWQQPYHLKPKTTFLMPATTPVA
ncbi:MAG TPA: hypothetical protein VEH02_08115, partial [Pseudolabrys sp.]|nr:hypothetical protein [Pseudolabrys sp.]